MVPVFLTDGTVRPAYAALYNENGQCVAGVPHAVREDCAWYARRYNAFAIVRVIPKTPS